VALLRSLLHALRALLLSRHRLVLENLALRQQLIVLRRAVKRPNVTDGDRLFWLALRKFFRGWQDCLLIVKPATVLRWHSKGWRAYWRRKSQPRRIGRPTVGWQLARLIRRLSLENVTWGAPRIHDELRLLGHDVGESTVARYMAKHRNRGDGQGWMNFLRNHLNVTVACDFFVVPTVTFKLLYAFVILSHDRRRIVHVAVTPHPTAAWTACQVKEAFPGGEEPRYLLRDNDSIYGEDFARTIEAMGIEQIRTSHRSPWENPYCERVIGTLRRECTDHIIALGERHLQRVLREYVDGYYNTARTHLSLDGNAPIPRTRESAPAVELQSTPVLGGLHHRYTPAA